MPPIRDLIILGAIVTTLPLCFIKPFYGVGLWTVLAFLNPHRMAWGPARDFPVALLVAVATVAGFVCFDRRIRNLTRTQSLLILALWGWFTFTTEVTTRMVVFAHHANDTWAQYFEVCKIILMTLITICVVEDWTRLRRFVLCIAGAFGLLVLKTLPWMLLTRGADRAYGPDGTMIADNNDFGLALNMVFPIFFFLARSETSPRVRKLFWLLTFLTIPTIFFTWSRGALVGLAAVVIYIFLGSRQKLMLTPILGFALTLAIFFTPTAWQNRMTGVVDEPADGSVRGRFNAWHFAWNLATDYPLTGGGFETFTEQLFQQYAPNTADLHASHSIYFGMLAEQGFVGLGLFLSLLTSCLWSLSRLRRYGKATGDQKLVLYSRMLTASLIAYMVSGAFLGRHYFDLFYDVVACVVMLTAAVETKALTEDEDTEEEDSAGEEFDHDAAQGHLRELGAV